MSFSSLPATLSPALSGREAIADAIYRCVIAYDTDDLALFESSFTSDAIFEVNGKIMNGLEAIKTQSFVPVSKMDTNHFISNIRINVIDPDSKAQVTCSALAQHYRSGEGMKPGAVSLLAGSLYWADVTKDVGDEIWRIKHIKLNSTWIQGDSGVLTD
ncbi:hypothetical protein CMQ_3414 [Grosmannia clavigera kw1407]|uniref:SnoaL-like domain-containing protein n=1 Tax=Grosmannia clavigera (strain kw1407 / UAMH 11150) TaxID=655863 RepID=F0X9R0_GROCL|nr:uncharacterized protein CMQ_3414 [Grosmannia clavigera kw1407]EFX05345.1 hypothetical protein CMQ_3414 [Grosmannia clavigera kw1407]